MDIGEEKEVVVVGGGVDLFSSLDLIKRRDGNTPFFRTDRIFLPEALRLGL